MDLKDLRAIWAESGFRPDKALGQNFLVDGNVKRNILGRMGLGRGDVVVEIGPGFGMMTFDLAETADRLVAVEKDHRICGIMEPYFERAGNIELVNSDILKVDIASFPGLQGKKVVIYGNVPYYISTPIIERMIEQRSNVSRFYLVIQEELADRLVARPGSRTYGSVSCYVQYHSRPRRIMKIKKNSFYPVPRVDSSLLELEMLEKPSVESRDPQLMFSIIRKAFSQRRKKMVNPLSDGTIAGMDKEDWKNVLEAGGIDVSSRAEALSLEQYAVISDRVLEFSGKGGMRNFTSNS